MGHTNFVAFLEPRDGDHLDLPLADMDLIMLEPPVGACYVLAFLVFEEGVEVNILLQVVKDRCNRLKNDCGVGGFALRVEHEELRFSLLGLPL